MKLKNLMFEDWVLYLNKYFKIIKINDENILIEDYNGLYENINICNIEPIPITLEILNKIGFKHTYFKISNKHVCLLENDKFQCYLSWHSKELDIELYIINQVNEFFTNSINIKINYIHELQHALKLCNVNLKIKL